MAEMTIAPVATHGFFIDGRWMEDGDIVEIQATGEKRGFSQAEFEALFALARQGIGELVELQTAAVAGG